MNNNYWWNIMFLVLRTALLYRFISASTPLLWLFAASEALVLYFNARSLNYHHRDLSHRAKWTPVCYMTPLLLNPEGLSTHWILGYVFSSLCLIQIVLRLWMGKQATIAVPQFGSLIASGPYSVIRHPLALTEMCIVVVFTLHHLSYYNIAITFVSLGAMRSAVWLEERFLLGFAEYRAYVKCVPSRLNPLI